jgi:hypothetical protein
MYINCNSHKKIRRSLTRTYSMVRVTCNLICNGDYGYGEWHYVLSVLKKMQLAVMFFTRRHTTLFRNNLFTCLEMIPIMFFIWSSQTKSHDFYLQQKDPQSWRDLTWGGVMQYGKHNASFLKLPVLPCCCLFWGHSWNLHAQSRSFKINIEVNAFVSKLTFL